MKAMIATFAVLALLATACVGTVVVGADDEGVGGAGGGDEAYAYPSSCMPCFGVSCGYCPESPGRTTYRCFEGMPPPSAGSCYQSGDLFTNSDGDFYTCSLCRVD